MSNTRRPSAAPKATSTTDKKRDDEMDRGLSFVDADGTRLSVRIRDVKGKHDAALVAATGLDFMGLLEALQHRQGLDLLAAVVWFGRLVHGRESGTYTELLDDFDYEAVLAADLDEPNTGADPEA